MSDSKRNLFSIWFGENRAFTIRYYKDTRFFCRYHWGKRPLGKGRFAIDCGGISFIFENYGK